MSGCSYAHQMVSCGSNRPPNNNYYKFDHDPKASMSSSTKRVLRDLPKIPILISDVQKAIKETSVRVLDTFVDHVFTFVDDPYLPSQRNFAPVDEIEEAVRVTAIEGEIPDEFPEGVFLRNGSNPIHGGPKSTISILGKSSRVWIEGEGMIHALYFNKIYNTSNDDSNINKWNIVYKNKYVETDTYKIDKQRNKPAFIPAVEGDSAAVLSAFILNMLRFGRVNEDMSNTNIIEHAGKYYSTAENDMPQEIDIFTLQTLGPWRSILRSWNRPFSSHPKKAPGTGELVTIGFDARKPYLVLGCISADGKKLIHKVDLKLERSIICHEMGITQRYNIILDVPLIVDPSRLFMGGPLMKFEKEKYARIGVMPRYGDADSMRWFEVEPCTAFHIINCYEEGDEVVVMACRAEYSIIPGPPEMGIDKYDWFSRGLKHLNNSLNNNNNNNNNNNIDNKKNNNNIDEEGMVKYNGLAKLCLEDITLSKGKKDAEEFAKVQYHMFPENAFCTGSAFVAKNGDNVEEDDGWIVTFVHNETTDISQVYIVDAKNFSSEPVAKITLPCRVPYGFHGAFMPFSSKPVL
ncbi:hypothetical protein ABFS82_05G131600 [Erythranthe guttata]